MHWLISWLRMIHWDMAAIMSDRQKSNGEKQTGRNGLDISETTMKLRATFWRSPLSWPWRQYLLSETMKKSLFWCFCLMTFSLTDVRFRFGYSVMLEGSHAIMMCMSVSRIWKMKMTNMIICPSIHFWKSHDGNSLNDETFSIPFRALTNSRKIPCRTFNSQILMFSGR
jgi:hypothetical protein